MKKARRSRGTSTLMRRRLFLLLFVTTHLLAAVIGYGVVRMLRSDQVEAAPEFTKLAVREGAATAGNGNELLADFLDERSGRRSRYAELKATLPVARDVRGAVISAVEGLGGANWASGLTQAEQADRLAEVEVRVWHWMKQNPAAAMGYVMHDGSCAAVGLPERLNQHVWRDLLAETGVLKSLGWLARSEAAFPAFCEAALAEIRRGGGLPLFVAIDDAISRSPVAAQFREFRTPPLDLGNPVLDGQAAQELPADRFELLAGFGETDGPAAEWLLAQLDAAKLDAMLGAEWVPALREILWGVPGVDFARRLELLRAEPPATGLVLQDPVMTLVAGDVQRMLDRGRDWRFEFRHGRTTSEDVLLAVRSALPEISPLTEEALRVAVYRELAEEDPAKALKLLASFPPEKRREILLRTAQVAFHNVSPDLFLRFLADVPDARTPAEQEWKIDGWESKTSGNLWRYGDDYIEWVTEMPASIHKEAAMSAILRETTAANPAAGRELNDKFYPRKP